ncbi:zinc metalloprotease [Cellvibrio zantedeschiae]|uniref:Zinc metalloprotease n=1 Tax=Cellvibrio zantedeschiae TaxID=1237077 RepID=A0ABQ3APA3_9GAMM|nr:RIP metalloprotease RseP [Cellvibrio zantedeschiae]GGY63508.1 zinc metalloprotease [Cellvibrio zantedeschiae]
MDLLNTIASFLVAIIVLVTVHEFGHFYVARLCGVRVLRFSLGFGKVLWRKYDKQGTEFSLSALPLGGYVKMLDEREGEVPPELLSQAFNRKSVGQRMAIVVAGPVANFILAILLFWGLLLGGERGLVPIIGAVEPKSIAAKAGLEVGQEILSVDGEETPTEQSVARHLISRLGESGEMQFNVRYPDSNLTYEIVIPLDNWMQDAKDPEPFAGLGIDLGPVKPIVGDVLPNTPADRAGFKAEDKIVRVNDLPVKDWRDFQNLVRPRINQPVTVDIERKSANGATDKLTLSVTPESFTEKGVSYGRVGMAPKPLSEEFVRHYEYSVGGALVAGVKRTWDTSGFVLLSVKKLILGEISTKNLSGPISIAKVAGSSAQIGLKSFIGFLALLSVFLGVFNLLPIPVLDGGHLLYLSVELIKGKPVSEKVQVLAYQFGLVVVIGLSMLAMYNDIMRL